MSRASSLLITAVLTLALLAACGGNDDVLAGATSSTAKPATTEKETTTTAGASSGTSVKEAPAVTVTAKNLSFDPKSVSIKKGDSVKWVFDDGVIVHNVTGRGFKSGDKDKGEFVHTFTTAGTVKYTCTLHPGMDGEVKVA